MQPQSLANLHPLEKVRPEGTDSVQVRIYLPSHTARQWRRLTPTERGELVELALRLREQGQ